MPAHAVKKAPAKKAVKRAAAKRPAASRSLKPSHRHMGRQVAREGESFWVNNGPVCATIPQLRAAIAGMTDEQFNYHTKRAGNDFAAWVAEAMEHRKCAEKLGKAQTRAGALRALAICEDC